jgi:hypothetical protein
VEIVRTRSMGLGQFCLENMSSGVRTCQSYEQLLVLEIVLTEI